MVSAGKLIASIATLGVVGGGSGLSIYLLNNNKPTELQNKLTGEGFELLDVNVAGGGWTDVLTDYRVATKNIFADTREEQKTEEDLRKNCKEILNNQTFKEKDYLLARQWCVKKVKVTELLSKNYAILNSKDDLETERNSWKQRVVALLGTKDKYEALKNKVKTPDVKIDQKVVKLKEECETLKKPDKFTTSQDFEEVFEQIRDYCSIKKTIKG